MAQLAQASPTAPVPPQNLDAEESVLGAMMLSPGAIGAVSEVLSASDFYRASHATIYKAALSLWNRSQTFRSEHTNHPQASSGGCANLRSLMPAKQPDSSRKGLSKGPSSRPSPIVPRVIS